MRRTAGRRDLRPAVERRQPRALPRHLVEGFARVKKQAARAAASPSASPSRRRPTTPNGIIGDLGNLPGFRGGVALGPMLEDKFGIPIFINNDGDLFVYGEAIAGFLPYVNGLLEAGRQPQALQEPVRRDARHRLRRRHRARRRTVHRRQLDRRRSLAAAQQARPGDERRGRRLHPRRPPRLCREGRHSRSTRRPSRR